MPPTGGIGCSSSGRILVLERWAAINAKAVVNVEKRFVLFLVLSLSVLTSYSIIRSYLAPPPPPLEDLAALEDEAAAAGDTSGLAESISEASKEKGATATAADAAAESQPAVEAGEKPAAASTASGDASTSSSPEATPPAPATTPAQGVSTAGPPTATGPRWVTLGSYEPQDDSPLLVTLNSRGAAVERVELTERTARGKLRYSNLEDQGGYLGHLALITDPAGGCRVNVVGARTPAALATPSEAGVAPGLLPGDILKEVAGQPMLVPSELDALLSQRKPLEQLELVVEREEGGTKRQLTFTATLSEGPLQLIRPGGSFAEAGQGDQLSFLFSMIGLGEQRVRPGGRELSSLASLREGNWEVLPSTDPTVVEFRFRLPVAAAATSVAPAAAAGSADAAPVAQGAGEAAAAQASSAGGLEIIKRYRLGKREELEVVEEGELPFHLNLELEIRNQTSALQQVTYRLDGPNGLPLEGWWYSNKIHPAMFYVAGARDVVWQTESSGHQLLGCSAIHKVAAKESENPDTPMFATTRGELEQGLKYAAVDSQYFLAAVSPQVRSDGLLPIFDRAEAYALGDPSLIPSGAAKTTNVSFFLNSLPLDLAAGETHAQAFRLFLGPKSTSLLSSYNLQDCIYYGWFGPVSRLLSHILHLFYRIVQNYAVAIILLTILVRSCMFPLSRKAAQNAAMMQELAPEMKKIAEKYKNDMEKRGKAQQELFKKHNYNPFSGCWMVFVQLPIFVGLYRCLSVDVELRQAPLWPGLSWCSDLAGPDQLFGWRNLMGLSFFTETGLLGPYFNLLPIFTIGLFLVHQKLFTPPATDEQTRMQLTMMKYMTVFIGVMFFKVPAGLCLYFIASSLWGIAERKLLPKKSVATASTSESPERPKPIQDRPPIPRLPNPGNSSGSPDSKRKKRRN